MNELADYIKTPAELAAAKEFLNAVNSDLNDIKNKFFHIGYLLTKAYENRYFKILGYATITDLAEDKFDGLTKAVTYNLMQIYHEARDFRKPDTIADKYKPYSQSQILAISRCKFATDDLLKRVKPSDSVVDIKKFVSLWNKYCSKHSATPECKSVADLLEQYGEGKAKSKAETNPDTDLFQISEITENSKEDKYEISTRVEISEEKSSVSEEPAGVGYPGTMTNEELSEYCLKYDVHEIVKFNIIDFYINREPGMSQFKEHVKSTYLNYALWGAGYKFKYCEGSSDNFTIFRKNGSKNILAWSVVAGRISRLIQLGDYLDDREKESYLKWKAEVEAPSEGPEEDYSQYEEESFPDVGKEIEAVPETAPRRQLTNREYLTTLSDEQFVSELCLKIIRVFPMGGKSSQFMSTVQSKLTEWFGEIRAEADND